VLEEEGRLRGQLLESHLAELTDYERATLEAARSLRPDVVVAARLQHKSFVSRMDDFFNTFDLIITPSTATTAFPVGRRPEQIDGDKVGSLWGAFPFTAAFNVAGTPAVSLPCGLSEGMPVGMQLVCGRGRDAQLLDIAEEIEEVLSFDMSPLIARYVLGQPAETFA
jgi:Asp-tRNA(Asn)/Glu-tRNA(Gln) amidotransferase A subunit family amidase